jgi:phenylalanyl-tRNA synthetase alpha chain
MMLEQFTQIGDAARADLAAVTDAESLEAFRIQYLGKKGSVTGMLSMIGKLPKEQKREGGQLANQIKQEITAAFDALKADLGASTKKTAPMIDVTLPGVAVAQGKSHIISQTVSELLEIFGRMGFDIAYGPEVEDDWHNFIALNIPPEHPARDPIDNFYIDDSTLLRSQTSTIQIRVMENTAPPIRVVAPGRVYRPDTVDATHMFMFHQLEADGRSQKQRQPVYPHILRSRYKMAIPPELLPVHRTKLRGGHPLGR